jgi:PEGA domain
VNPKRLVFVLCVGLTILTVWPTEAAAQRRFVRSRSSAVVFVGGGFYRPYFYDPFFSGWYPAYPFYGAYPIYPPYPGGYWYGRRYASARIQVTPKQAEVYLDGYYVGQVDDFDGVFQRLDVPPGEHELEVYLQGYRPYRQKTLFRPGEGYKFQAALEPLPPGEAGEPRPTASGAAPGQNPSQAPYPPPPGPGRTRPLPDRDRDRRAESSGFGTLALRVQPPDAVVEIDGERWDSPEGGSRLVVQLPAGPHRIEVRKDGFRTYSSTVTIRAGDTETLNVSLSTSDSGRAF